MGPKLVSIEEVLDINSPLSASKAEFRVTDDIKFVWAQDKAKRGSLKLAYKGAGWSASYNVHKQDFHCELKQKAGPVKLELSQHVPHNKWFLVPNPAIEASTSTKDGTTVKAKWDFMKRHGKVGGKLYFGSQAVACKAYADMCSHNTLQYGMRAKLVNGMVLRSVAAHYCSQLGPHYALKAAPVDELKLKATYLPLMHRMQLQGKLRPTFLTRNLLLTLDYSVPLDDKDAAPAGTVSIKWTP